MPNSLAKIFLLSLLLVFFGCQVQQESASPSQESSSNGVPDILDIRVLSDAEVVSGAPRVDRQRMLADLLYEALQALNEDRLLTPIDDNAHARFKRVLAVDSDNEIALQGLQDIVARYLQLAEESIYRGLFEEAKTMLDRAGFVDKSHPDIAGVSEALRQEMKSEDLFFELDYPQYASRTEQAREQLADIARQAREHEAFFLIIAPNDDLGRWMVAVMREAVTGYRLRGNIELASRTSIRLRMPASKD